MCASYNPPTRITPIFCSSLWPSNTDPYSQTISDQRYVQTTNQNQSVGGTKTFNLLGKVKISAGNPLELTQLTYPSNYYRINAPPSVPFNVNVNLPSYSINTTDEFITGSSSQIMINKTVSGGTFSNQSMFTGSIYGNNSTNFPITRSFKSSRTSSNTNPAVISYGMQWPLGGDTFGANSAGTYLISLSLQSGDFGLTRAVWLGYAEMSGFGGAKCQVFTILQSNIASVTNDTFGNITITFSAGVTPNTTYEITQTQIGY